VGSDGRKSKPLVEAQVAAIEGFQIAVGASVVCLCECNLDEARTDPLALGRRSHADYRRYQADSSITAEARGRIKSMIR
jgi:hypothetical protein